SLALDQIPHPTPNHAQLSHRPTPMPAGDFRFPAWPEVSVRLPGARTSALSAIPTAPFHVKHAYTSVLRNTHTCTEPRITRKNTLGPAAIHHTITHGPIGGLAARGSPGCWPLPPNAESGSDPGAIRAQPQPLPSPLCSETVCGTLAPQAPRRHPATPVPAPETPRHRH